MSAPTWPPVLAIRHDAELAAAELLGRPLALVVAESFVFTADAAIDWLTFEWREALRPGKVPPPCASVVTWESDSSTVGQAHCVAGRPLAQTRAEVPAIAEFLDACERDQSALRAAFAGVPHVGDPRTP